jgi:hypothetical protein
MAFQLSQNSLGYWIVLGEDLMSMGQYHKEREIIIVPQVTPEMKS